MVWWSGNASRNPVVQRGRGRRVMGVQVHLWGGLRGALVAATTADACLFVLT